jgi:hypothetical protein
MLDIASLPFSIVDPNIGVVNPLDWKRTATPKSLKPKPLEEKTGAGFDGDELTPHERQSSAAVGAHVNSAVSGSSSCFRSLM